MKRVIITIGLITALIIVLIASDAFSQVHSVQQMKLNSGIITAKLAATKTFYTQVLHFGVTFENDFYLLLHTPGHEAELSFLLPDHWSQQDNFKQAFSGEGMYITIEVPDVDRLYQEIKAARIPIEVELRDEPWGDRHFVIVDPNGIGIDLVTYRH